LPTGAEVLEKARAAVLSSLMAPTADAGWSDALTVLLADLDMTMLTRRAPDAVPAVLELGEAAALLATMLGRREVLVLTGQEWADAAGVALPDDPDGAP
jgi:hypothetical protein